MKDTISHTETPSARKLSKLIDAMRKSGAIERMDSMVDLIKAARKNPSHRISQLIADLQIEEWTPREIERHWWWLEKHLPKPPNRRGARKGSGRVQDPEFLEKIVAGMMSGMTGRDSARAAYELVERPAVTVDQLDYAVSLAKERIELRKRPVKK